MCYICNEHLPFNYSLLLIIKYTKFCTYMETIQMILQMFVPVNRETWSSNMSVDAYLSRLSCIGWIFRFKMPTYYNFGDYFLGFLRLMNIIVNKINDEGVKSKDSNSYELYFRQTKEYLSWKNYINHVQIRAKHSKNICHAIVQYYHYFIYSNRRNSA